MTTLVIWFQFWTWCSSRLLIPRWTSGKRRLSSYSFSKGIGSSSVSFFSALWNWGNEWVNEWMIGWMIKWKKDKVIERTIECLNEWKNEWMVNVTTCTVTCSLAGGRLIFLQLYSVGVCANFARLRSWAVQFRLELKREMSISFFRG